MIDPGRMHRETQSAREQAEALLRSLYEAKAKSEKHLADIGQSDAFKRVTGRSSYDNAIQSAQRMIDSLSQASSDMEREAAELSMHVLRPTFLHAR